jgi:Flp pilus assembly protein TadG
MKRTATRKSATLRRVRTRRGVTLVLVAIVFTVLMSFLALALDFGRMYAFKAELHRLTDAAESAAARDRSFGLTKAQAEVTIAALVAANTVENNATTTISSADITSANWNFATASEQASVWGSNNAVRVAAHYTANWTFARIFGSNTRVLNDTSLAAYGSLETSSCLKPFAFPYASILERVNRAPTDTAHAFDATDLALLNQNNTDLKFVDKDPPGGNQPGNFGWVDVAVTADGNKNDQIAAALTGCVSSGIGVGQTLPGITGARSSSVIVDSLRALCGGVGSGNGINYFMPCNPASAPILISIYSTGREQGNNTWFDIKYIGAFKMTRLDNDGLWGRLISLTVPASGTLTNTLGPVSAVVLVK